MREEEASSTGAGVLMRSARTLRLLRSHALSSNTSACKRAEATKLCMQGAQMSYGLLCFHSERPIQPSLHSTMAWFHPGSHHPPSLPLRKTLDQVDMDRCSTSDRKSHQSALRSACQLSDINVANIRHYICCASRLLDRFRAVYTAPLSRYRQCAATREARTRGGSLTKTISR